MKRIETLPEGTIKRIHINRGNLYCEECLEKFAGEPYYLRG